ncbi:hypothetical protein H4S08_004715, partial [Coemansia sp. RSA 1365]
MDHLMAACHITDPSEVLRGVNGCGNSINLFSHLNAFSSHAVSAEETPLAALSETFCQVHPLGQSRTGQLQSTGHLHLLPQVLTTVAARSTDQVVLILASLLQVTANGSKFINKPFKCSTKAVNTNSTNELPLQMLSRFRNIIVQPGVAHNLSAYQVRMALAFSRVHKPIELAWVNCVVLLERATNLRKVTRKVPFKIGSSHHNGKFSPVKDDYAAATEPLSGALKAQHLISFNKEECLADDEYKVNFIYGHQLRRNKTPLFLVRWKGYEANHDTCEPEDHFSSDALVDAYCNTLGASRQHELALARGRGNA